MSFGVEPIEGELYRFHVVSRSEQGIFHLVDFTSGRGVCSCHHGQTIVREKQIGVQCHHVMKATAFVKARIASGIGLKLPPRERDYVLGKLFAAALREVVRLTRKPSDDQRQIFGVAKKKAPKV